MALLLLYMESLGRSAVPLMLFLIRLCTRLRRVNVLLELMIGYLFESCILTSLLSSCLTSFTANFLTFEANPFAFVRLCFAEATDLSRYLTDELLVDTC